MKKILILFLILNSTLVSGANDTFDTQKNDEIIVLWDASLSMLNRNVEEEITFLKKYLTEIEESKLRLIVFSNTILSNTLYDAKDFQMDHISDVLRNIVYDGSTNFNTIEGFFNPNTDTLLFTDGEQCNIDFKNFRGVIINSTERTIDGNNFIELDKSRVSIVEHLTSKASDLNGENLNKFKKANIDKKLYTGVIYINDKLVDGAQVYVEGSHKTGLSNREGYFEINAKVKDTLTIDYYGKVFRKILEDENDLVIKLYDKIEQLNEVKLFKKQNNNSTELVEKVETGYGTKDKRSIGYAVQTITNEDFNQQQTNLTKSIQGKFNGINIKENDLGKISVRGGDNPLDGRDKRYAMIIVDGVRFNTMESNSNSFGSDNNFVDPNNVESVTVLKGLAATNIYGSDAANGVLIIKTKTGSRKHSKKELLVLNKNNYQNEAENLMSNASGSKDYIDFLRKETKGSIYNSYLKQRLNYLGNPYYFLDVYKLFKERNIEKAYVLLSNIEELFSDNIQVLKLVAFDLEAEEELELALRYYLEVLKTDPLNAEHNLDVARMYSLKGNFNKALEYYKTLNDPEQIEVPSVDIKELISSDTRSFIKTYKNKINDLSMFKSNLYSKVEHDLRIVIKWNNTSSKFDLQFVNPLKKFSVWGNYEEMNGYGVKEFYIDTHNLKELKGEWLINVNDYGSDNNLPNYFLVKVYKDYGRANQKEESFLYNAPEFHKYFNIYKVKLF
jgi:TonB-dependent SusC/RagA subfamily outer membrane receptor